MIWKNDLPDRENHHHDDDPFRPQSDGHDPAQDLTPDLTDRIMRELGFRRVSNQAARDVRFRRARRRMTTALMMVAVCAFGIYLHSLSDRARVAMEGNMHDAVARDVRVQGLEMREAVQSLGNMLIGPPNEMKVETVRDRPTNRKRAPGGSADDDAGQSRVPWAGLL